MIECWLGMDDLSLIESKRQLLLDSTTEISIILIRTIEVHRIITEMKEVRGLLGICTNIWNKLSEDSTKDKNDTFYWGPKKYYNEWFERPVL